MKTFAASISIKLYNYFIEKFQNPNIDSESDFSKKSEVNKTILNHKKKIKSSFYGSRSVKNHALLI